MKLVVVGDERLGGRQAFDEFGDGGEAADNASKTFSQILAFDHLL